ncbi:hypothetical protein AX15_004398 [Amanita polypyramis BW_CC]|nr:hypothetical protein AX15_004398 [Amanita polypyramis BW_CC]
MHSCAIPAQSSTSRTEESGPKIEVGLKPIIGNGHDTVLSSTVTRIDAKPKMDLQHAQNGSKGIIKTLSHGPAIIISAMKFSVAFLALPALTVATNVAPRQDNCGNNIPLCCERFNNARGGILGFDFDTGVLDRVGVNCDVATGDICANIGAGGIDNQPVCCRAFVGTTGYGC